MKEFENNHHYSEQRGHRRRSEYGRTMRKLEKEGLNVEQRYLIKRKMFRDRRDGR